MSTKRSTIPLLDVDQKSLHDLLQMNIDSRDGFAYAGERLAEKHSSLSMRFHRYSQQRNEFCEKLKGIGEMNHQEPIEHGTIAASLHRTWMDLKDQLNEVIDVSAVITEAIRGESYIKESYETAINQVQEPRILALLKFQYESVQESYSWLADLHANEVRRKSNAN